MRARKRFITFPVAYLGQPWLSGNPRLGGIWKYLPNLSFPWQDEQPNVLTRQRGRLRSLQVIGKTFMKECEGHDGSPKVTVCVD